MQKEHTYIASVVATYWFVSISMVYLNKVLMSNDDISIPAPLFVTWFQCVVTAFICWLAGEVAAKMKPTSESQYSVLPTTADEKGGDDDNDNEPPPSPPPSFWSQFPRQTYTEPVGRRVLPLSLIFVGMITFNNLCLKWVEVSFYNVARSLTIVFNVLFSSMLLGSTTSSKTLGCIAIVIFGFFLGSNGEINFSLKGTIAGVASSLFVSLNSIFTKKVLPVVDNDHWRLTYYNNINACVLFLPLMFFFEYGAIMAAIDNQFLSGIFWSAMMVSGFFGFAIGIVTVLQIKATSPLTHNISGTAKAAFQSILAFRIWGNKATAEGILGIFTVLGGSLIYTLVKMNESKPSVEKSDDNKESKEESTSSAQKA